MRARRLPLADARKSGATTIAGSGTYAAYVLGLLTLINLLNYLDRNVVFAVFEPVKHELHVSDQQLGWLGSAYIIVLSICSIPLGVLSDLKSRRTVIAWSLGFWSLFTALGGFVRGFGQLVATRALVGVGEAGYAPASQAIIADYYKGRARAFAMGIYSVGTVVGGILGIWLGGVIAVKYGWRWAFIVMGIPGVFLTVLAARIRELNQRAPTPIRDTIVRWYRAGVRRAVRYVLPVAGLSLLGAVAASVLDLAAGLSFDQSMAVFGVFVAAGLVWTVARLVPVAVRRTAQAGDVAASAFEEFLEAATVVLRTPTLIWVFLGGAMVTFAVNGLSVWAATFMSRVHGLSVPTFSARYGPWALAGAVLGVLVGGKSADWLQQRWAGGRVVTSGVGFILAGPLVGWLLISGSLRGFAPLIFGIYFFYTWYNGPLAAVIFDVVPAAVRASVAGAFVLFSHLAGDALAPPLVGYLSDKTRSIQTAMVVLPVAGVVGGLVILVALKTVAADMKRVKK
ncbi:MAG TPA: MFS transporter [Gemmatimonadales bacterium]|jgi:MFS family permease|nr:MFS transporter [Gemmatimonadales bacterium]